MKCSCFALTKTTTPQSAQRRPRGAKYANEKLIHADHTVSPDSTEREKLTTLRATSSDCERLPHRYFVV